MKTKLVDRNKYRYYIGIDPGTNTGLAIWDRKEKKYTIITTTKIHRALQIVRNYIEFAYLEDDKYFVVVEDARKRKFFSGENVAAKQQGAGSIKRDCSIWEDFLNDFPFIDYEFRVPRNTKMDEEYFKKVTGWKGRTSNHARDAAISVFQL